MEDVAKALDISVPTVSRKVNGSSDFLRHEIDAIRELLGLSMDDILKIFFANP